MTSVSASTRVSAASGPDRVRRLDAVPGSRAALVRAGATAWGRAGVTGTLPDTTLEVDGVEQDLAEYAAYARVCGLTLRDHVTPTWLHVRTFPLQLELMTDRAFPFAVAGMVHIENRMTLHRPVSVTDTLDLSVRAERMTPHRAGTSVDLVGVVRVDGATAWEGRSRYLVRGPRRDDLGVDATTDPLAEGAIDAPAKDEMPPVSARWRVPADIGRRYAAVAGDVNPIHLNPLAAKAFGFPRTIAHGMWTHARALAAVERDLPEAYRVDAAFLAPLMVPSTVGFGTVTDGADRILGVASTSSGTPRFLARVNPLGA